MPFEDFRKKLEDRDSPEHVALLAHVKALIDASRTEMAKNYSQWDEHDMIFRSRRAPDHEDRNAEAKGAPKKMIVPLTYSQILTFVAFSVMSITQNQRFYELEPTGTEDNPLAEPLELILERDLRRNSWNAFLVQFFLDIGRFSLAAAEVCYKEDVRYMRVQRTEEVTGAFGAPTETVTNNFEAIPVFVGNKVYPVSPYRFYPDVSLPLSRYQEGEYCGSEDIFSHSSLESGNNCFNLDKIPKFSEEDYKSRRKTSRLDFGPENAKENKNLLGFGTSASDADAKWVTSGPVAVTKIVFDLNPSTFAKKNPNLVKLGAEDFKIRYLCWYANDGTIVRFEEAYYLHCQFPYICAQYLPDQHKNTNESLADVCEQITNLITWKINAHIASQKNSVESRWAIDPMGVDTKDLESRKPYIYLKKAAQGTDVRRYITQFKTEDVTQNVLADTEGFKSLLEGITGWSAQMQGQYSQGRRSATQDRVVAQGAGARGKCTLGGIWDTAFEPLGKQLIANNRQEMDFETFARIVGERTWPTNPETQVPFTIEEVFAMFKSDPIGIATSEDFFVFDGTLPSEKAFLAQSLQEILMQIMTNPVVAQVMGFDATTVRELFNQVYLLRGVTPARLPAPKPVAAPGQLSVVPPVATSGAV